MMDKEYIERDVALKNLAKSYFAGVLDDLIHAEDAVNAVPTADVRPVVRGEWIKDEYKWTCSNCGEDFSFYDNAFLHDECFCPNCGADMREKRRRKADV